MQRMMLSVMVLSVAACGIKKPLVKPMDIPAFEEKQRKKREKFETPAPAPARADTTPIPRPNTDQ